MQLKKELIKNLDLSCLGLRNKLIFSGKTVNHRNIFAIARNSMANSGKKPTYVWKKTENLFLFFFWHISVFFPTYFGFFTEFWKYEKSGKKQTYVRKKSEIRIKTDICRKFNQNYRHMSEKKPKKFQIFF